MYVQRLNNPPVSKQITSFVVLVRLAVYLAGALTIRDYWTWLPALCQGRHGVFGIVMQFICLGSGVADVSAHLNQRDMAGFC